MPNEPCKNRANEANEALTSCTLAQYVKARG